MAAGERARHPGRPRASSSPARGAAAACTCWRTAPTRRDPGLGRGDGAGPRRPDRAGSAGVLDQARRARACRSPRRRCWPRSGSSPSVGRPHIADALVAAGHVARPHRGLRPVPGRRRPGSRPALRDRRRARDRPGARGRRGGGDRPSRGAAAGEHVLPPEVLAAAGRASIGLDGIEVDHQDHDAGGPAPAAALAERLGLLATGSSDYHGTGKTRPRSRRATPPPGGLRRALPPDRHLAPSGRDRAYGARRPWYATGPA